MTASSLPPQKIGLLGGSFNPAHDGHREISLAALKWLGLDSVWWLVTPGNPLKEAKDYAPYPERLATARLVADHERIVISNFEYRRNLQYTADTLKTLCNDYSGMHFVWLMGADSLKNFHLWRHWRDIAQTAPFAVFNRPGYETDALQSEAAEALAHFRIDIAAVKTLPGMEPPAWVFFDGTDNPASSTAIRKGDNKRNTPTT